MVDWGVWLINICCWYIYLVDKYILFDKDILVNKYVYILNDKKMFGWSDKDICFIRYLVDTTFAWKKYVVEKDIMVDKDILVSKDILVDKDILVVKYIWLIKIFCLIKIFWSIKINFG